MTRKSLLFSLALALASVASFATLAELPAVSREQLDAVLWQQRSVERRALAAQAFREAARRLRTLRGNGLTACVEQEQAGGYRNKPPAIVLDIDETVLDNTPFSAMLVREGRDFDPDAWRGWIDAARAAAVPGAPDFIRHARAAGFRVAFITDRECARDGGYDARGRALHCPQKRATLDNLEAVLGYRPAQSDLLMRFERKEQGDPDKRSRRLEVARTHRIAMLVGDALNDFINPSDYSEARHGTRWGPAAAAPWILLPNPVYGTWERPFEGLAGKYAALEAWDAPAGGASPADSGRSLSDLPVAATKPVAPDQYAEAAALAAGGGAPVTIAQKVAGVLEGRTQHIVQVNEGGEAPSVSRVTVVRDGLLDDSVRGDVWDIVLERTEAGAWRIREVRRAWRCWRGGQTDRFATQPCP